MDSEHNKENRSMPTTVEGDLIIANIGDTAANISIGKNINSAAVDNKRDVAVVHLVIDRDITKFSDNDQKLLLATIERLLNLESGTVKVIKKSSGSVILSLEIPYSKLSEFEALFMRGMLDEFDVNKDALIVSWGAQDRETQIDQHDKLARSRWKAKRLTAPGRDRPEVESPVYKELVAINKTLRKRLANKQYFQRRSSDKPNFPSDGTSQKQQ